MGCFYPSARPFILNHVDSSALSRQYPPANLSRPIHDAPGLKVSAQPLPEKPKIHVVLRIDLPSKNILAKPEYGCKMLLVTVLPALPPSL
jgi:hypothetical protein